MKGLLIKDWKLLLGQKQFFLVTGFIVLVFLVTSENPAFVVSYATIMYTVFTISTISYDDHHNGMTFLFTLPVSRKEYVIEKYSFGILSAGITAFLVLSAMTAVSGVKGDGIAVEDMFAAEIAAIMVAVVFLSFTIPIQLKFGAEKGRMALMAVSIVIFILIWGGASILKKMNQSPVKLVNRLDEIPLGQFACGVLAACAVLMLVSAAVSLRFLKQREF